MGIYRLSPVGELEQALPVGQTALLRVLLTADTAEVNGIEVSFAVNSSREAAPTLQKVNGHEDAHLLTVSTDTHGYAVVEALIKGPDSSKVCASVVRNGRNQVCFDLNKGNGGGLNPDLQVTSLEIVSGNHQAAFAKGVGVADPAEFAYPLEVVAKGNSGPTDGAQVRFVVQPPSDVEVVGSHLVMTKQDTAGQHGIAKVAVQPYQQTGLVKVVAFCNNHSVIFELAVTAALNDLVIAVNAKEPIGIARGHSTDVVVTIHGGNPSDVWPYIPIEASIIGGGNGGFSLTASEGAPPVPKLPLVTDSKGQVQFVITALPLPATGTATLSIKIGGTTKEQKFSLVKTEP